MTYQPCLRTSLLPLEHLDAELIVAPLASRVAFETVLVSLSPKLTGSTKELWRETEVSLLRHFPGMSIDELIIRRDRCWFSNEPSVSQDRPLALYLLKVAKSFFEHGPGLPRLCGNSEHDSLAQRRRWRWMTFALPQDLLLAAVGAPQDHIDFISPLLRHSLEDRGLAETHLHLKAAIEFPMLWASLQCVLATDNARSDIFAGPAAEFDEGRKFGDWLLRCSLARLALAGFLANPSMHGQGLGPYLRNFAIPRVAGLQGAAKATMFSLALCELEAGKLSNIPPSFTTLRQIYKSLIAPLPVGSSTTQDPTDPLSWWFLTGPKSSPEFGFIRAGLKYLETSHGGKDTAFARLFWQVERLRVIFYRHIVQRPMTPGLLWFARTYARLGKPRSSIKKQHYVENAIRFAGNGIKSLEVRLAPDSEKAEIKKEIQEVDKACQNYPDMEAGIVYHFSRTRGSDAEKGHPKAWGKESNDDPGAKGNPSGYRLAGYYIKVKKEAIALAGLLHTHPLMLERVRGIDLCTDELGVPLWVVKPIIEHVRKVADQSAARIAGISYKPVKPLRLTVHAGEDFVHLLGGIRRVGETVEYLKMEEGDRIGHGVAMGVNPAEWASRANGLAVPRGERLFDLLWARRIAMKDDNGVLRSWLPWLTEEIPRLAHAIFNHRYPLGELDQWIENLHSTHALRRAGFPNRPAPSGLAGAEKLLDDWLRNQGVFNRAQELERVNVKREVDLVTALQEHVLSTLARRGIVVEINPSSNLLIGHLGDIANHPLWRLSPPNPDSGRQQQVRVCIGSDDPITFATSLIEEYQLLADSMLEGGVKPQDIDAWLERARQAGLDTRFTVPRSGRQLKDISWSLIQPTLLP